MRSSGCAIVERRLIRRGVGVWLLAGVAALTFAFHAGVTGFREPTLGFTAYYTSAWLVVHDTEPPRLYDSRWFIDQVPRAGIDDPRDIFNVNPPAAALLFLPLVWLDPPDAKTAWALLNLAFLAGTLVSLRFTLPLAFPRATGNPFWFPALCGLALVATPIQENLRLGQMYGLLLLLATLALSGIVRESDRRSGLALGAMLVFKTAGVLLWVVPLMERRFRVFVWGSAVTLLVVVASFPSLGTAVWWEYPQWLPSLFNQRWTGQTAYQTLPSIAHHLTTANERYSPQPPLHAAWLGVPLSAVLVLAPALVALFALWPFARDLPLPMLRALRFGALLALSVPLQPLAEEHHYALLLPSIAMALLVSREVPGDKLRSLAVLSLAIVGACLVIVPIPYESNALLEGWLSLLAYPRVYGALLVASSLIISVARHPNTWSDRRQPVVARVGT